MDDGRGELRAEIESASTGRFDAFISYSHRADDDIAPSIRNGLQRLAKPWFRRRAMRVFLDRTNMSADPALWTAITRALDTSKGFVLLMSPESASSPWVNREIDYWVARNGSDRMLPVLTSGELVWDSAAGRFDENRSTAAPPSLAGVYHEEPRYIDLRWADGQPATVLTLRDPRFADAMAEIAAPIREVNKDELVGADLREHRKTIRIARAAVVMLSLLLVASLVAATIARSNAQRANRRRVDAQASRLRAESSDDTLTPDLGFMLAVEAYRLRPGPATVDGVIKAAQRAPDFRRYVHVHKAPIVGVGFDVTGKIVVSYDKAGELVATEWSTGTTLVTAKAEANGAGVYTTANGVLVVGLSKVELRDPSTLAVQRSWAAGDQRPFAGAVVSGSRVLLLKIGGSIAAVSLEGPVAAAPLRWTPLYGSSVYGGVLMPDGSFITAGVSDDLNELIRFTMADDGQLSIRWRQPLKVPVSSMALSVDTSKVILGFSRGILSYNVETGEGIGGQSLQSGVNAVATSPALGSYVLSANQDGRVAYLDLSTQQPFKEQIHEGRATSIAWSPGGHVATGDGDGTMALLDSGPNRLLGGRSIDLAALGIAIRSDGHSAVAALDDGNIVDLTFDVNVVGSKIQTKPIGTVNSPTAVALLEDIVVVGDEQGTLHALGQNGKAWSVDTGTTSSIAAVSSVGSDMVVTRSSSLVLQTWRVEDGKFLLLRTLSDRASTHSLTTDPSGTPVVAYFEGSSGVVVANAVNGVELARYPLDSSFAEVALAPDGLTVAVSNGSDVQLLSTVREPRSLRVGGDVTGLSFMDNGSRIVAFDPASGARVVGLSAGQPLGYIHDEDGLQMRTYAVGSSDVVAVATAGGRSQPAQVMVISFDPAAMIADGCRTFGRELTPTEIERFDLDRSSDPCEVKDR